MTTYFVVVFIVRERFVYPKILKVTMGESGFFHCDSDYPDFPKWYYVSPLNKIKDYGYGWNLTLSVAGKDDAGSYYCYSSNHLGNTSYLSEGMLKIYGKCLLCQCLC